MYHNYRSIIPSQLVKHQLSSIIIRSSCLIIIILIGSSLPGYFVQSGHRACAWKTSLFYLIYRATYTEINISMEQPTHKVKATYTRKIYEKGYIYGGDIYSEGSYTERYTHGGAIYAEAAYIRKELTHERYISKERSDTHVDGI